MGGKFWGCPGVPGQRKKRGRMEGSRRPLGLRSLGEPEEERGGERAQALPPWGATEARFLSAHLQTSSQGESWPSPRRGRKEVHPVEEEESVATMRSRPFLGPREWERV